MSALQKINKNSRSPPAKKENLKAFVDLLLSLLTNIVTHVLTWVSTTVKWMSLPTMRFTVEVSNVLSPLVSPDACQNPIQATETVQWILNHLLHTMGNVNDDAKHKTMVILSRCSRGGKTTVLKELHRTLKVQGISVISVTFSTTAGLFKYVKGETECEALFRVITNQLNPSISETSPRLMDWEALDRHIGDKPFVLLIDGINSINIPIGSEVDVVLKTYFLNRANRHIVATSYRPFLDGSQGLDVQLNERSLTLVPMPVCYDVQKLSGMDAEYCDGISRSMASYYGGIPSLMFTVSRQAKEAPAILVHDDTSYDGMLDFVDALLTGIFKPSLKRLCRYTSDAQYVEQLCGGVVMKMKWPLCYIICILSRYGFSTAAAEIVNCIKVLASDCKSMGDEMVWEQSIRIAILLRFVLTTSKGMSAPFDLCGSHDSHRADIRVMHFCDRVFSVKQARTEIELYATCFYHNTLVLYVKKVGELEQFDGFCVRYCATKVCDVSAFQWRDRVGGNGKKGTVPEWINRGGHRLRSTDSKKCKNDGQDAKGWTHYNDADTDEFLGWSLQIMSSQISKIG